MNHVFRVVFNCALGCWQAVAELAKSSGKLGGSLKKNTRPNAKQNFAKLATLAAMAAGTGGGAGSAHAQTAPGPNQLPQGGNVTSGDAQINRAGNVMNIDQSTQKAIINWQEFNVGQDATVNFNQPNASAATLNRVLDSNPSQIFGRIVAPGQVILINPNGAYFAPSASVDVGGLIATTHELADKDFLDGNYQFKRNGATGKIINEGELKAKLDGYIALMAPEVRNQGVIIAERGTVALASGEHIQLDFGTGHKLQGITVTEQDFDAQIENRHAIIAEGGLVILSARATAELRASVIKNSGQIVASAGANTVTQQGGRIILEGNTIEVTEGAQIIATGPKGGGEVLIGGDWQGGANEKRRVFDNPKAVHQATTVTVQTNTKIDASATDSGDGGTVVVWSDAKDSDSVTTVQGEMLARGGENGGDGGQIETSGYLLEIAGAAVNAGASAGVGGLWLLDPSDSTVNQAVADTYVTTLNTGTSVLNEVIGTISIAVGVKIEKTGVGDASLVFKATENIRPDSDVTISSTVGELDVTFWSDSDANGTGNIYSNPRLRITSNGGDIVFGGGADPLTGAAVAQDSQGVRLFAATLNAGGGDISLRGQSGGYMGGTGVDLSSSDIRTTGAGQILIAGSGSSRGVSIPASNISSENGSIVIQGVSPGGQAIAFGGTGEQVSSVLGGITLDGDGQIFVSGDSSATFGGLGMQGNVRIITDNLSVNKDVRINTSGDFVLQPKAGSFTSGVSTANLTLSTHVNDCAGLGFHDQLERQRYERW